MAAGNGNGAAAEADTSFGLIGLAVMGQNFALNVAEHGFDISVYNRSSEKTDDCVRRAEKEGLGDKLKGYHDLADFVQSLSKPRVVMMLVKAGAPVDATIEQLTGLLEPGDTIIDGGNEWYENTERRAKACEEKGFMYMGMGVSGGEAGARKGPSLMPGGPPEAYARVQPIVEACAAQVDDGPCVTHIGPGGSGNFVKQVHNGIEYGDMQLIAEAYDILANIGGLTNAELAETFTKWNTEELDSYLVEITSKIFAREDDQEGASGALVEKILDKTGMKGTGKWTVQQAAELSIALPTVAAALDARFISGLKDDRVAMSEVFAPLGVVAPSPKEGVDKAQLVDDVKQALYCSKICSYAQGMNLIRAKSEEKGWNIALGECARIWKGGCIIRAGFLSRIKQAYDRDANLQSLLVDPTFAAELADKSAAWRRVVALCATEGVPAPAMLASLSYFDSNRRARLPANLVQAQRDYFGSHSYERTDREGWFHTVWSDENSADSITTSVYKA